MPSSVAAAVGLGLGVSAIAGLGGAVIQANAQKRAAQIQADALREATTTEERMQVRALGIQEPFRQGGLVALQAYLPIILGPQYVQAQLDQANKNLADLKSQGAASADIATAQSHVEELQSSLDTAKSYSLQASPLYQFEQDIGQRNLNRQLVAQGLYGSGAGLEAQGFFQRSLSAEEGTRQVGYLQNLIGVGAGTSGQQAQTVVNTGQQIAGLQAQTGQALAQGTLGAGQAYAGALQSIGGQFSQGAGLYGGLNYLNQLQQTNALQRQNANLPPPSSFSFTQQ